MRLEQTPLLSGWILFITTLKLTKIINGDVSLYTEDAEVVTHIEDCDTGVYILPNSTEFKCACVNGIYSFGSENCESWETHGGRNRCFRLKDSQKINRIEFLNKDSYPSLTVIDSEQKSVKARYSSSAEFPVFRKGDILLVQGTWTLLTTSGQLICVSARTFEYCFYEKVPKFITFRPGCHGYGKRELPPSTCHHFNYSDDGACSELVDNEAHRDKRAIRGRTFLPASLKMAPPPPNPDPLEHEEDHGLIGTNGSEIIKSEIWTYVIEEAFNVVKNQTPFERAPYATPAYELLDIAKNIIMKGCPEFYVPASHWNMTVTSFITMQQRSFRFREDYIDLTELVRIRETLQKCLANATLIPFIPPNATCVDGEIVMTLEEGSFYKYGELQNLMIPYEASSLKNEPLIETVWKIFVHVHSLCYPFFKMSKTNDHHRFTTILSPLFTNDVWDIWMKDTEGNPYELKSDVYAGLFGDAKKLMTRVDYCAWYPRFEAEYPWDLIRPAAKQSPPVRRRRSNLAGTVGTCAKPGEGFTCK